MKELADKMFELWKSGFDSNNGEDAPYINIAKWHIQDKIELLQELALLIEVTSRFESVQSKALARTYEVINNKIKKLKEML